MSKPFKENYDMKAKMLSSSEISEPGYYWWLPVRESHNSDKPDCWSVVSWHPQNPYRQKSGTFYGPLVPPPYLLLDTE